MVTIVVGVGFGSVLVGYAIGLMHAFFLHLFCPRCHYYLAWRNNIRGMLGLPKVDDRTPW